MSSQCRARRARATVCAAVIAAPFLTVTAGAQRAADTTGSAARADSVRRIESVIVSALRASDLTPVSQKTIGRDALAQRSFGQEVPMLLNGMSPSLSAHAENGTMWGYSYFRLRGIDQSRINLTLDGIPLNDPEDQVLYFADFPDLGNSLESVQVQRGVGTSSNGTASFAGSINLQSLPLITAERGSDVQLQLGSFGSRRGSIEHRSGLTSSRFATYARLSSLKTDGYREHSGVEGRSGFLSAGYFGDRDIVKLTATAGLLRDTMAYYAVPEADLRVNRRANPLTPQERDGFGEQLVALSYTRLVSPTTSVSTTVYRISASGDYDVAISPDLWNFNLDFVWYGITSAVNLERGNVKVSAGINADTYARDHYVYVRPDFTSTLYRNTGHKRDASAFAKATLTHGAASLFGDLQVRHARFRYTPDVNAGIAGPSVDWTLVNPKAGVSYALRGGWSLYGSYGSTTREPTRNDMFAGFDNLDTTNVDFVGPLTRVHPERVHDTEVGANFRGVHTMLQVNLFSMAFRNEIAPIGALSYIGAPLRKNVAASARRGFETDVAYRGISRLVVGANAALNHSRIRDYTDDTADPARAFHDVEPLLTPHLLTAQYARWAASPWLDIGVTSRFQSRAYLDNSNDASLTLPAYGVLDASVTLRRGAHSLTVRGENLNDSRKYSSGYGSGGVPAFFVLPPRSVFAELRLVF